jgi:glucose-6-phosphate 1-dehydrogenase
MDATNPLRHGERMTRLPEPCAMVIFGGSGDLTRRKLVPALYDLFLKRLLPQGFTVLGLSRSAMSDDQYREILRDWVGKAEGAGQPDQATWSSFARGIHYLSADFHQPVTFEKIGGLLSSYDAERGTAGNRVFYLATAPGDYIDIIGSLQAAGLSRPKSHSPGWIRIIIEKPYGRDLASAMALDTEVHAAFQEEQVYRIDHYLGKETVQNILVLRFANGIYEPVWNRRYVDNVQITAAESIGVGTRGGYYEQAGALRDMIQNHMMQLLALVAMEPPVDFEPNSVRDEKAKVLRSIRPFTPEEATALSVRAQYAGGFSGGKQVPGYRQEKGVSADSITETFAGLNLTVDNWRWAGVPFYLRTGKNLARHITEIAVTFRGAPHLIFGRGGMFPPGSNVLVMRIQPDEGITMKFFAKSPGQSMNILPVNMDFRYGSTFGLQLASAYERLLLDCMLGDNTLFDRSDSMEMAWKIVQPVLDSWSVSGLPPLATYASGSWGPTEADDLLSRQGRRWRLL